MDKDKLEHHDWLSVDYVRAWYNWKMETGVDSDALKELLNLLQALLSNKENPRILDLGCGPGRFSKMILDAMPGATVLGVDYSPACGQVVWEVIGEKNRARFEFFEGTLNEPQWVRDLGVFDAAVSSLVIHDLKAESHKPLFEAVMSVLTDGGVFLNFDHVGYESPGYTQQLENLQQKYTENMPPIMKAAFAGCGIKIGRDMKRPLSQLCELMRQVGFESVEVFYRWLSKAIYGGYKIFPS